MKVRMLHTCFIGKKKYEKNAVLNLSKAEIDSIYPLCQPLSVDIQLKPDAVKAHFNPASDVIYPHDGYGKINRDLKANVIGSGNVDIYFTTPHGFALQKPDRNKINVLYTMFEANKLPDCWIPLIKNNVDHVIVPSKFCLDVFEKAGIKAKLIPLYVDNLGIKRKKNKKTFTFGMENAFLVGKQKGWDVLITAFEKLSAEYSTIRLKLKGRESHYQYNLTEWVERAKSNKNINVTIADFTDEEMAEWYSDIDCFVFPSRGEGFGLPPLQAMRAGIPTILTNAHGLKDFAHYGVGVKTKGDVPSHYVNRVNGDTSLCRWVDIDEKDLYIQMEDVFLNYFIYEKEAKKNAKKIAKEYGMLRFIKNLDEYSLQIAQNS